MRYEMRQTIAVVAAMGLLLLCLRAGRAADAEKPAVVRVKYASGPAELGILTATAKRFTNRKYTFPDLPEELDGLTVTRRAGGSPADVVIDAPGGATVYLLIDSPTGKNANQAGVQDLNKTLADSGWERVAAGDSIPAIYKQSFPEAKRLSVSGAGFTGVIVASKNLELDTTKQTIEAEPPPQHSASTIHADVPLDNFPTTGPSTRAAISQTSVKSVGIGENPSGLAVGEASILTLTTTPSYFKKLTAVRFATPVGDQICLARDDALRFIRLTYPNWNVDKAEITFDDKYVAHDGGSVGAAVGVMVLSCIQGFAIDPDAAIAGGITATGDVHGVAGIATKIKDATQSKCTIVAVPAENLSQLVDDVIYNGPGLITDIQVIGMANLDDAVAAVRTDHDPKLTQAIALFAEVQKGIKNKTAEVKTEEVQTKLKKVLELSPRHLSAQVLLSIAQGKEPKTLSAAASQYYTFVAVGTMTDALTQRPESTTAPSVPSNAVRDGFVNLRKLRPQVDASVRPLIDAWIGFIGAWNRMQEGIGSNQTVGEQRQALLKEMSKEDIQLDQMQKMLKEGM